MGVERIDHDLDGAWNRVRQRFVGVVAATRAADDEVGVHQRAGREPIGGEQHLRIRAPHEDPIVAGGVRFHVVGEVGRVGSVVERSWHEQKGPGHGGGDCHPGNGSGSGSPGPSHDDRYRQQHERWHDLQPVVPEEPQSGRPRRPDPWRPTATGRCRQAAPAAGQSQRRRRRTRPLQRSAPRWNATKPAIDPTPRSSAEPMLGTREDEARAVGRRSSPRTCRAVRRSPLWRR